MVLTIYSARMEEPPLVASDIANVFVWMALQEITARFPWISVIMALEINVARMVGTPLENQETANVSVL